jgi:hypothetical protein
MRRADVHELHYIVAIDNLASILKRGIYSYSRMIAEGLTHVSVANADVQARRDRKVPGTDRTVHDHACLYVNGRNPMMFTLARNGGAERLAVLGVSTDVLDIHEAVIADANAAAGFTRFFPSPEGIEQIDRAVVYAKYWTHDDPLEQVRHKQAMCAEVLVPDAIEPEHIERIHVSCEESRKRVRGLTDFPVDVTPGLFFE